MSKIDDYRKQIEDALVYSGHSHTYEDVVKIVENGSAQAWYGPNSIIITQLVLEPQYKVLHFFLAGGVLAEIEAMMPEIEKWGRDEYGCRRASLVGRKGWERTFLKRQGWTNGLVLLEKEYNAEERG